MHRKLFFILAFITCTSTIQLWASDQKNSNQEITWWGWAGPGNNVTQKEVDANEQLLLDLIADTERAKIQKTKSNIAVAQKKSEERDEVINNRFSEYTETKDGVLVSDIQNSIALAIAQLNKQIRK